MRIMQLNTVDVGSTGRIMLQIANAAREYGHKVWTYSIARKESAFPPEGHKYYGSYVSYCVHYVLGKITGCNGMFSLMPTLKLIVEMQRIKPDVIHLHNLHGFSINLPLLFRYLKRSKTQVIWTLHDCWAFTGHCAHYSAVGCSKWKTGCYACPIYKAYPESIVDNSKWMWSAKNKWFLNMPNMILATPSKWLEEQAKESFLREYPIRVINNGIDIKEFSFTPNEFREKHGIPKEKSIVLGVAFGWGHKKGMDVFLQLVNLLGDGYQIVLVGTNDNIDAQLPSNILSIHRTNDQKELAEIYSAADVLVNPTREDTFPTVNIESLACGTPVITFRTGGSPEIIDHTCGSVVECDDVDALKREIIRICNDKPYSRDACIKRALQFDQKDKFKEYVKLYEDMARNK